MFSKWSDNVFWQWLHPKSGHSRYSALSIKNVRLPDSDPETTWTVICDNGAVSAVIPYNPNSTSLRYELDAEGGILVPSLCHSHIHLDKCFLLDKCEDLKTGDFAEAMTFTGAAKAAFPSEKDDLMRRGRKLIRDSIECGVTALRAHVEVDKLAEFSALRMALQLREEFKEVCYVQIAVFAQEALFDGPHDAEPGHNLNLVIQALEQESGIEVVGSAPYVEPTVEQAKKNIAIMFELASRFSLHLDFHLDYNLNPNSEPLIYEVIAQARKFQQYWLSNDKGTPKHRITIGHATRLQLFTRAEWQDLVDAIGDLPITFVGLPHSDMYMQGREFFDAPLGAPRSTLRIPQLTKDYGLEIAMSINNVQNCFTPQGFADPLSLCPLGVAIFQSATKQDIEILMRSVTITSKLAVGQINLPRNLCPSQGDPADFVILHGSQTLRDVVLNPPYDRTTIKAGIVVARRVTKRWLSLHEPFIKPWYRRIPWFYVFVPMTWSYVAYRYMY
ncbi:hypothetical protein VKT23_003687 [Stygiomarasmius scandens]|uniref:Metallo-dependent hydrolase n=1 Tax=Marasmiellus scandens TaxID=2682957 RepID=A0ABR1K0R7_9AGAR